DPVAHLVEVVLVLRLHGVERDRIALHPAATAPLHAAPAARLAPDAGGRTRSGPTRAAPPAAPESSPARPARAPGEPRAAAPAPEASGGAGPGAAPRP